jgi:hypothetical protein
MRKVHRCSASNSSPLLRFPLVACGGQLEYLNCKLEGVRPHTHAAHVFHRAMSNQHKHAEPKTTQRTKLNDWMTATSDALFALLGGVVVFALFTMLLRFIKEAASFQCPSGPLYKACGFVKDKGIFTLKRCVMLRAAILSFFFFLLRPCAFGLNSPPSPQNSPTHPHTQTRAHDPRTQLCGAGPQHHGPCESKGGP